MSYPVTFYKVAKKANSTYQPTGGDEYQCTPRHTISILSPVITVNADIPTLDYNYCYIPRYKRYYWITDAVCNANGLWSLYLSCDVLATYRTDIGASTEYIARAASASDGGISDSMYPAKAGAKLLQTSGTSPWVSDLYTGTFIIGIINNIAGASSTAVTYYAMTAAEYGALLSALQNQTTMQSVLGITVSETGIVEGLTGCLKDITYDVYISQLNPIQYIVSSVYIPISRANLTTGAATNVNLGRWTIPIGTVPTIGYRIELAARTLSVPKHPQASTRGAYLNYSPYSQYTAFIPAFGTAELDGGRVGGAANITYKIVVDSNTGAGYCFLNTDDSAESVGQLGILSGCIGVNIPVTQMLATDLHANVIANVAQIASNILSPESGIVQAATDTVKQASTWFSAGAQINPYSPTAGIDFYTAMQGDTTAATAAESRENATAAGILNGVQPIPTLSVSGSVGGNAGLFGVPWLKLEYFEIVAEDNETLGRPLMQTRRIDTLSGFIKCLDTHIITGGTSAETSAVNQLVQAGFFYE